MLAPLRLLKNEDRRLRAGHVWIFSNEVDTKSKIFKEGTEAYRRLNQMGMQVLAKDGILISCSCSYHLQRDELRDALLKVSRHIDRSMQIVEEGRLERNTLSG